MLIERRIRRAERAAGFLELADMDDGGAGQKTHGESTNPGTTIPITGMTLGPSVWIKLEISAASAATAANLQPGHVRFTQIHFGPVC